MCLSDPIPTPANDLLDAGDDNYGACPYPEDPGTTLFSEVCNLMEVDSEWLKSEPRSEETMLLRYFSDQVCKLKEIYEYSGLLQECLDAVGIQATA